MEKEKTQDVSDNVENEAPEKVQQEAESQVSEETSAPPADAPEEEVTESPKDEVSEDQEEVSPVEAEKAIEKEAEKVEEVKEEVVEEVREEPTVEEVQVDNVTNEEAEQAEGSTEDADATNTDSKDTEEEEEEEELDFSHADKNELLAKIKEVKNEDNIRLLDRILKAIKPRFDELYEVSKNEALQQFVSDGNEADAFEFHGDEIDKEFFSLYGQLRSKRNKHYKDLESQKEDNLKKKEHLLEQLRLIVDGEESSKSIEAVRELQADWKKVGPVPGAMNKTLWANYNALLDRYYDNRSIYFELKDLDRKKNLKLKEDLCEKAEALAAQEDLKTAIVQLNDLHDEYKHIGPVPKDDQEPLWQRFKAASDAIYAKRKDFFDHLKVELEENLVKKNELIQEVESFTNFTSDRITEWNAKTKEILEVQKKWEAIGGVPREKAKETNKAFWHAFKGFFAHKNQFFKELESKREENLQQKLELVEKAEAIKDSEDWNSTADKLKHLQGLWKDIGPVPEKVRNETYKKFKAACDHFFNRRRDQNQEQFKAYEENLQLKLQVCDQLEAEGTKSEVEFDTLYDLIDNYTSIGFVPKNAIKKIRKRFDEVKDKILSNESIHEGDRSDLRNHIQMGRLRNTPGGEQKLNRKEHSIKRKISSLENDISTWNTNMEFFAHSATADKLKAEMQERINKAEDELQDLKSQLAAISSQN